MESTSSSSSAQPDDSPDGRKAPATVQQMSSTNAVVATSVGNITHDNSTHYHYQSPLPQQPAQSIQRRHRVSRRGAVIACVSIAIPSAIFGVMQLRDPGVYGVDFQQFLAEIREIRAKESYEEFNASHTGKRIEKWIVTIINKNSEKRQLWVGPSTDAPMSDLVLAHFEKGHFEVGQSEGNVIEIQGFFDRISMDGAFLVRCKVVRTIKAVDKTKAAGTQ